MMQAALAHPIKIIFPEPQAPVERSNDVLDRYFRDRIRQVLNDILIRVYNCDGASLEEHGVGISESTLSDAYLWVEQFYVAAIESKTEWIDPLISPNDDGKIVFEWWSGTKKLTVRVGDEGVEAIKRWGVRPHNMRQEIEIGSDLDRRQVWLWLTAK